MGVFTFMRGCIIGKKQCKNFWISSKIECSMFIGQRKLRPVLLLWELVSKSNSVIKGSDQKIDLSKGRDSFFQWDKNFPISIMNFFCFANDQFIIFLSVTKNWFAGFYFFSKLTCADKIEAK